ncbi:MAG: carboxymuconolactone decarboxylase family protein [Deltaproteobacteria bacterium]|nr:carboxymuconolactone decarboxylase family protein [bacterium]MCB9489782.1 carboxymuconolactone decarboxylase family protein [Deltaproteobacteria bacterium]
MQPRMKNPAMILSETLPSLLAVGQTARNAGVPAKTCYLMYLRASQINGCGFCVDMHSRELRDIGETQERLASVAAWRHTPYFTDAERAALALTEATTLVAGVSDPVPDEVWNEAAEHYNEKELAALVLNISLINFWNRMNIPTGVMAGTPVR